ncbi:MAG TPA: 50S ribosomal protein L25/general stress protein Ctc [Bacteroidales bacterium]|nr:50S ribosomal protein L25/general stress protein Ctc [Bacteroidales bacterium]HQK37063.1 50S ribosomal protein L25/general stress protein Ctc [Bacteroidales bacterium]
MKTIEIKAEARKNLGKKETEKLRKQGMVPGVLYGGSEPVHFYVPENNLRHLVYTPNVYIVNLTIDSRNTKAILQDIQFHPVTDHILHIDFKEVFDDKPVVMRIPIKLTGSSVGVRAGGKLKQSVRYLKVKGLIKDLPDQLTIDISDLNIGKSIRVGDLSFENIELLDNKRLQIVSVQVTRAVVEETPGAAPAEGTAEGAAPAAEQSAKEAPQQNK